MSDPVGLVPLAVLLGAAAWTDARTRRIPRVLTVGGLGLALAIRAWQGPAVLWAGLEAAGLVLLVAVPLAALRVLGGGDAKLLVAAAAFLGPERLLPALLYTAVAGGVLALLAAARRRVLVPVLLSCRDLVVWGLTLGRSGALPPARGARAAAVPYGIAIAVGCFLGGLL